MPPVLPLALSLDDAKRETEDFLTVQISAGLAAGAYGAPSFAAAAVRRPLAELTRAEVETRHVPGTSDAAYRIRAVGDELLMRLQLNVRRFALVYLVPVREPIDSPTIAP